MNAIDEIRRLKEENKKLLEAVRWYNKMLAQVREELAKAKGE